MIRTKRMISACVCVCECVAHISDVRVGMMLLFWKPTKVSNLRQKCATWRARCATQAASAESYRTPGTAAADHVTSRPHPVSGLRFISGGLMRMLGVCSGRSSQKPYVMCAVPDAIFDPSCIFDILVRSKRRGTLNK